MSKAYVSQGAVPVGNATYANPGTVDAQHYCLNFKVYP